MNICYISSVDISLPDGPGVNEREFAQILQEESIKKKNQVSFIIPRPSQKIDFELKQADYYINPKYLKIFLPLRMILASSLLLKHIIKKIKEEDDFYIIRLDQSIIFIVLMLSLMGKKYCIKTLSDIYNFNKPPTAFFFKLYHAVLRKIVGYILKKAFFIDVCTPQFLQKYCQAYKLHNIAVVDNAVNIKRFHLKNKTDCKRVLGVTHFNKIAGYCGGYPSRRGAKQLIEVAPMLIKKYPECGILIIGEDTDLQLLKKKARLLQVDDHIVFTGLINYEQLNLYLNCFDVGIGFDTINKIESVGNSSQKIRQYIACGAPVICPENTNGLIANNGLGTQVSPDDLNAFFKAISYWFDYSTDDREQLRKKCHRFAENNLSTQITFEQRYNYWENVGVI